MINSNDGDGGRTSNSREQCLCLSQLEAGRIKSGDNDSIRVGVKSCIGPGRTCKREGTFEGEVQIEAYQKSSDHLSEPVLPDLFAALYFLTHGPTISSNAMN